LVAGPGSRVHGDALNFVAFVEGPAVWPHAGTWLSEVEPGVAAFEGWHPSVTDMLDAVEHKFAPNGRNPGCSVWGRRQAVWPPRYAE
jgi:hypothetical protein